MMLIISSLPTAVMAKGVDACRPSWSFGRWSIATENPSRVEWVRGSGTTVLVSWFHLEDREPPLIFIHSRGESSVAVEVCPVTKARDLGTWFPILLPGRGWKFRESSGCARILL